MLTLREIAHALGGEVVGRQVLAPGPGHSPSDRSVAVRPSPTSPGGVLVWSHGRSSWQEAKDHVLSRLGVKRPRLVHKAEQPVRPLPTRDDRLRGARAVELFHQARDPRCGPVERYLASRGLALPNDPARVLRYHPACPFAGAKTPTMVALVVDVLTGEPRAIHRTAVTQAGGKAEMAGRSRLSLGPVSGGAVRLTADEDLHACLGIAEGIETALSLRLLPEFGASPVWSVLSANGIASFPVIAGVESLWIAVDHDEAGERAARACASRWRAAGREVFLVKPKAAGADLNDVVRALGD